MARKAGEALSGFKDYLADYDLKARGAGSDKKKGPVSRFSGLDVRHVFDNRGEGVSESEGAQAVLDYYDGIKDDTKSGGGTQKELDKLRGYVKEGNSNTDTNPETPTTKPGANSGDATAGDNSIASPVSNANPINIDGNQNRVAQDNSVTNTQNFDNRVDNSRDNRDYSMRYYGGGNGGGKYGGADDSPAAAQKFIDMYTDSLVGGQRDIRRDYGRRQITDYSANDPGRDQELNKSIKGSIADSRKRSDDRFKEMYGNSRPFDTKFKMPEVPDPITSNTEELYDKALKKMK
jgi:hypothetical protein